MKQMSSERTLDTPASTTVQSGVDKKAHGQNGARGTRSSGVGIINLLVLRSPLQRRIIKWLLVTNVCNLG